VTAGLAELVTDPRAAGVPIDGLADALAVVGALDRRPRQLWITPPALAAWGLPAEVVAVGDAPPVTGAPRGVSVLAAPWHPRSPLAGLDDPRELFGVLWAYEAAVGARWWGTGARTSDALLTAVHHRGRPIRRTILPPPFVDGALGGGSPLVWSRAPLPADRGGWVHHYDANGAYLSAASGLRLPQGNPLHGVPDDPIKVPGYWRLEGWAWEPICLPDPAGEPTDGWASTPTLRLLSELPEGPPPIVEGWYWPDYSTALTPWYRALRDARSSSTGIVREMVKATYAEGVGRLGSWNRDNQASPLIQPMWRHLVVAESRARMWRRLATLVGRAPLAVQTDSVWVQHDDPDPVAAAADMHLPLGDRLGTFSVEATLPAEPVREVLADGFNVHGQLLAMARELACRS
jgi:hypothetical protein